MKRWHFQLFAFLCYLAGALLIGVGGWRDFIGTVFIYGSGIAISFGVFGKFK